MPNIVEVFEVENFKIVVFSNIGTRFWNFWVCTLKFTISIFFTNYIYSFFSVTRLPNIMEKREANQDTIEYFGNAKDSTNPLEVDQGQKVSFRTLLKLPIMA